MAWFVLAFSIFFAGQSRERSVPSGDEVLQNLEMSYDGLNDYTVSLDVLVDVERVKVPRMKATLYMKQPDKVHIESDRFVMIPREGIGLNPRRLRERYIAERVEEDTSSGEAHLKVVLREKKDENGLRSVMVFVDTTRWTVERLVVPLPEDRTMTARFRYTRVESYWLPSQLQVRFASAVVDTTSPEEGIGPPEFQRRRSMAPRRGTIVVWYTDYRVNEGLSDEVFEQRK